MDLGNLLPCLFDLASEVGEFDPWHGVVAVGRTQCAQQGTSALDAQGDHVDCHAAVVMAGHSPFHGWLDGELGM